jgi:DNA polymerase III delta prime subunit
MKSRNYWHIQLHPGKKDKSFTLDSLKQVLDLGVIGMGSGWENDRGTPQTFGQSAEIGDIVMIRYDGEPRALVEIVSEVFPNPKGIYEDVWFEIMRKVRVLCRGGARMRDLYHEETKENWTKGLFCPATFEPASSSAFIKKWHSTVLRDQSMKTFTELLESSKNLILTGPPGTGKTHLARQIADAIRASAGGGDGSPPAGGSAFVQFHPSYDYTDFVEGLKPAEDDKGGIVFRLKDGIFKDFCRQAALHEQEEGKQTHPFVFVIDEINRADLSRVFGELFYALEPSYRGKRGSVKTQYSSLYKEANDFYIPKNVYIIGTMNDIDRSVDSMDFALRRRFAWCEVDADDARFDAVMEGVLDSDPGHKEQAKQRYRNLNAEISSVPALGPHYQIGPAYFRNLRNLDVDGALWQTFWDRHLRTLVNEYVRGLPDASNLAARLVNAYNKETGAE